MVRARYRMGVLGEAFDLSSHLKRKLDFHAFTYRIMIFSRITLHKRSRFHVYIFRFSRVTLPKKDHSRITLRPLSDPLMITVPLHIYYITITFMITIPSITSHTHTRKVVTPGITGTYLPSTDTISCNKHQQSVDTIICMSPYYS